MTLTGFNYMSIFVRCSKSTQAIGQNQSRVFWLPVSNEPFECIIRNNARERAFFLKGYKFCKYR